MIDTTPPSLDPAITRPSTSVLSARAVRRLRGVHDWRAAVEGLLAELGPALGIHRSILFQLREVPDQGLTQSVASCWIDDTVPGIGPPTVIPQAVVHEDELLGRLAEEGRQGKMFAGLTSEIDGFLRKDFEQQRIRSFLSVAVFAHGHVWGSLAINDCLRERRWSDDEKAALEIVACAIGDAIERAQSEDHVSEIIRAAMLQASLDAVVVIDETGKVIEFNPAAEAMFGYRRDSIIGRDVLDTIIPSFFREGYANGGEYMKGRGAPMVGRRLETISQDSAGEVFPIELTAFEIKAADRRLFLASIRDLRERRRAEDEINRQREKLHQNEKIAAMGSLLAGVSHELNNPLAVVVAQSTLLHEFAADPQTKARAEKVRAAAERCGRIVKSFLGMVRLHPSEQVETDLNQAVRAALEVTAYGARSAGIGIETELADTAVPVLADPDHLTQVAANFLVNSQHALAGAQYDRRIKVRTFRAATTCGFSVEDNGPGVPAEIRHRIFESYFTTKPVGVGTGIGLSISRSIVERHQGSIRFEDVEPHGVRFIVELPLARSTRDRSGAAAASAPSLRRALIVDDEPDVASSLADLLELMGIRASILSSWPGATAALSDQAPDIVFCDLRMPGASGMAIYRDLIAHRADMSRRFVLVTGDLIGARAEVDALAPHLRPLILEKPFSTLEVRGLLGALTEQVALAR